MRDTPEWYDPWPPRDVLRKLIEATEHLLDDHDCDVHGHEEYRAAVDAGKKFLGMDTGNAITGGRSNE